MTEKTFDITAEGAAALGATLTQAFDPRGSFRILSAGRWTASKRAIHRASQALLPVGIGCSASIRENAAPKMRKNQFYMSPDTQSPYHNAFRSIFSVLPD